MSNQSILIYMPMSILQEKFNIDKARHHIDKVRHTNSDKARHSSSLLAVIQAKNNGSSTRHLEDDGIKKMTI